MSRKRIIIITVTTIIVVTVVLFLALSNKSVLLKLARPWIADNIIFIQKVRKLSDIIFLPQILRSRDTLQTYELIIKNKDLRKLNNALPKGDYTDIEAGGFVFGAISGDNKTKVDAKFLYDGRQYDVDVRYRGTTYDHWYFPKKSWHIKFKDESPLGMEKVDLIIPRDRDYLGEELNHFRAKKLGLLVPDSGFVNLVVNGNLQGTYWWVEDWAPEMLSKRGLEGCLFGASLIQDPDAPRDPAYDRIELWKEYTDCGSYGFGKLAALLSLLNLPKAEFQNAASRLLDIEKILTWEAATRLAGSHHAYGYNMRVFWNKNTGKFEFIPWDFGLGRIEGDRGIDSYYNEFISQLLEHDQYLNRRNEILLAYVDTSENFKEDLAFYQNLYIKTRPAFYRDRLKTESILEFNKKVSQGEAHIRKNITRIKEVLGHENSIIARQGVRIEYEDKLVVPQEKKEEVWDFLTKRFYKKKVFLPSLEVALETRIEEEFFNDVYFDTHALSLLEMNAGVRYRERSKEGKKPIVQIKISDTEGDLVREEFKFATTKKINSVSSRRSLFDRISPKEKKVFENTLASLGVQALALKPVLEIKQNRKRVYFSFEGKDIMTISLDSASSKYLWANTGFIELEIELNEIVYTEAGKLKREWMRAVATDVTEQITKKFPSITRDLTPKYNKMFNALADKIPLYRFLIKVGVL